MPLMSPSPHHSDAAGAGKPALESREQGGGLRSSLSGEAESLFAQSGSIPDFFAAALDGAMALVRADGGEIATLDDTRHVFVLRARRTRPRLESHLGPFGAPGRASQPVLPPLPTHPLVGPAPSHSGVLASIPSHPSFPNVEDDANPFDEIEIQSTQLLPATMNTRTYRKGERLIGLTWERGEAILLKGEDCRALPGGSAPPDPDAPWHLAVPILRPSTLAMTRPATDVIGVIAVYNRDPLWSFSPRDMELLILHADRVARGMLAADLARQNASQAELLDVLGSDVAGGDPRALYPRLRDVVRRMIDAPSFAVALYFPSNDVVSFEIAEHENVSVPTGQILASHLPPWWGAVWRGQTVRVSTPEERAQHPELCVLGWENGTPVQSVLAAPLIIGNHFLGAIVAGSPRIDTYAPEHERLFSAIARSAAVLIQNALLTNAQKHTLDTARRRQEQLSRLNNAVLTLNASLDLERTFSALVAQAAVLTSATVCAVFELNAAKDALIGKVANIHVDGPHTPLRDTRVPLDWRGLNDIIKSGQFQVLDHLESEWQDDTSVGRLLAEHRIRSCLVLPLLRGEKTLGLLVVYTPGQEHHFSSEETVLLQGLAEQGASAVDNARIFEDQQRLNRQLNEALEEKKELDRLKDDFILTVSHEFRTPVTAIEGYVTLIGRHGHKLEQEKLDQFATEIHQSTHQLMGMIDRLHDANSIESQTLQLDLQPVNLRSAAEEAIATLAPDAKPRMRLEIPENLWVLAEEKKLTTVFSNLLGNAIKYSPAGMPCQITARIEDRATLARQGRASALSSEAPERWVVTEVRDWGEGITPDEQKKLFQKFVRLSRSLTTAVRGTGLGLWICLKYIEVMGGDIWVESEYGQGSQFQFSLPYIVDAEEAQSARSLA
ncbi:MAG TPA: GAF domain-containing protein [Ktedonobacterales bacterium]|nr:GAF domain-containing protein [Ktedonobacterales bacterium]